jgi:hypothetical protein
MWTLGLSVLLALAVGVAAPAVAAPQAVRGGQFISMMQGNTLSGTNASGATVNIYFLPGGVATYEADRHARRWLWHIDKDGDVCVAWQILPISGTYRVWSMAAR